LRASAFHHCRDAPSEGRGRLVGVADEPKSHSELTAATATVDAMDEPRLTRRTSLLRFGGLVAGALVAKGVALDSAAGVGPAGVASGAVTCVLTPELTQGPYYVPNERVRRDITEGKPGTPLALALTVVDAATCKPIKGAAVDVWHCDASGTYSGVSAQSTVGKTFMRGVQRTDARGVA